MKKIKLNQFIFSSFFTLLVFQILIVWIFGKFSVSEFERQEEEAMSYILNMYSRNLDGALDKIDNDLKDILSSNSTLTLLKNRSDLQRWHASYSLSGMLEKLRASTEDVDGYAILDTEYQGFLMSRSDYIAYEELNDIKGYLTGIAEEGIMSTGWVSAQIGGKVYLLRCYNYGGVCICALLSEQRIHQILSYGQQTEQLLEFEVTDEDGRIICSSNPERAYGEILAESDEKGKRTMWYRRELPNGAFCVAAGVLHLGLLRSSPYFFIILAMFLISVLFMFGILRFMNHEIVEPVKALADASDRIRAGNLETRPAYSCRNMELTGLREAYVTMLDTIMRLKLQEYENVIRIKESELKYMHMQLKPHFFLNALSTINSMAYENENEEIHEFIQAFSKNIRYMFRVGLYTVRLEEEIANVEEYLAMQRLLYKDCFYAYLEVPEELKSWEVPQMLLHTFMENIFKHAVSMDSFITIFLRCMTEEQEGEQVLRIEIQNSGKAFNEEIIARINDNRGKAEDGNRGIGLLHTKEILSIMYGKDNLLRLENEKTGNSMVIVRIPERTQMKIQAGGGKMQNEIVDRG